MPVPVMTGFASAGGASWRIFLTPIDTFKTTLQVQGSGALELLKNKVKQGGVGVLYSRGRELCNELGRKLPVVCHVQLFAGKCAEDGRYVRFGEMRRLAPRLQSFPIASLTL